ncbi:hypothetical protein AQUCO_11000010v1 [Aquilegia coerulea]|uniref:Uncharacterized protein n=1 Tax=Aquilegia coerulea TaxID=218851 RepID=A0A2G5C2W2_AQUCA|nr:hypothetical protein AQUCO_11000010v1 [Aquilegia coerulea]
MEFIQSYIHLSNISFFLITSYIFTDNDYHGNSKFVNSLDLSNNENQGLLPAIIVNDSKLLDFSVEINKFKIITSSHGNMH